MHTIFKKENSFVKTSREIINNIPCLVHKPKMITGKLPTVILYHGWFSSKEFKRFQSMVIASFGFQVISPDALYHGERDAVNHGEDGVFQKYLWKIILQSIDESKDFIDKIVSDYDADESRIALVGSSMGALINGAIFAENKNIKCLVAWNGNYAWESSDKLKDSGFQLSQEEGIMLDKLNPINNMDKFKDRDILILHGIHDSQVPIESMRNFYKKFKEESIRDDAVIFNEYDGIDHKVDSGMLEHTIEWLLDRL